MIREKRHPTSGKERRDHRTLGTGMWQATRKNAWESGWLVEIYHSGSMSKLIKLQAPAASAAGHHGW